MEETISVREYTCSYIKQNDLAYVAVCKRYESKSHEPASLYTRNQFIELLKRNFDLIVNRDQVKIRVNVIDEKKQGQLTKTERKRWHNLQYEWMSVVKKKVVIEQCSPQHKQGWLTYDPDE